ncbi:MAG: glycosyltransferase, partial [Methanobrevibacter sp.]|nr:glycosyltransferase [Methanobrevibacter sp.]
MSVKISVVLPVYNVANYLRKCLDSLVNQTFKD